VETLRLNSGLSHVLLTCETWSLTIMMLFTIGLIGAEIIFKIMSCVVKGERMSCVI